MKGYFSGSIAQMQERCRYLGSLIPRNLDQGTTALDIACRGRLSGVEGTLRRLAEDGDLAHPSVQRERLRLLNRTKGELDFLESVAVTALCRWSQEDRRLNALTHRITREINFPLPAPVVSCISQRYYHTHPALRLISVPLAEGRFLLHLPDLYHELAHSLLAYDSDSRLDGLQGELLSAAGVAFEYLAGQSRQANSGLGPEAHRHYIRSWNQCWMNWIQEFFCDLFAVYMVGPAFAWSHLHLSARSAADPHDVPLFGTTTHPPDAARMQVVVKALARLGFEEERLAIEQRWSELLAIVGSAPSPEYTRCFPDELLRTIEEHAHRGIASVGCKPVSPPIDGPVRSTLNEAWGVFWRTPERYVQWEAKTVMRLHSMEIEKGQAMPPLPSDVRSAGYGTPWNPGETNPLQDAKAIRRARMTPWRTLAEDEYTISVTTLNDGPRKEALRLLQSVGIVRLRWQGDAPSAERLESLERWVGPARGEQNDFKGKVKALRPNYQVEANTGDSAKALSLHVDGTQDERTPAILAFQYDLSPTWGGESTFIDMAAVLADLPRHELESLLVTLARTDCATCTKAKGSWSRTFTGPLIRAEDGGSAVSIRFRSDDLMTVVPDCQAEFDYLKELVRTWEARGHVLTYTPHEGDVVLFDNWRLLHGRAKIGGRHQRIHDRMWIDSLLPTY